MIKFTKMFEAAISPTKATEQAAGWDFYSTEYSNVIRPNESIKIKTGIKLIIPKGYVGVFLNKSSLGSQGLILGAQVIDSDYRGQVIINLINISNESIELLNGQKIAQLVLLQTPNTQMQEISNQAYESDKTDRGEGGFGWSGVF